MSEVIRSRPAVAGTTPSIQDQLAISESTITYNKLLPKICFATFGKPIEEKHFEMMMDLYHYLASMQKKPVTRQAIRHWFRKNSNPSRNSALIFLNSYVSYKWEEQKGNPDLLPTQRKVYKQLSKFFRESTSSDPGSALESEITEGLRQGKDVRVTGVAAGKIVIDPGSEELGLERSYRELAGTYVLYRTRMTFSGERYIAKEVVRIALQSGRASFRHWFLFQDAELSKFDGVVSIIGNTLWFIGASHRDENRLRVMKFRYVNSVRRELGRMRWGIMLSEIPNSGGSEPSACKVVLIKSEANIHDIESFCRTNVKNVTAREIEERMRSVIVRLIDNNVTATSMPNTSEAIVGEMGRVITDNILRTNQETLENAIMDIFRI